MKITLFNIKLFKIKIFLCKNTFQCINFITKNYSIFYQLNYFNVLNIFSYKSIFYKIITNLN